MGKITWDTDCNAPCCPGQIVADDGRTILIQTDWDYPGVARTFGWNMGEVQPPLCHEDFHCDHNGTDGTVRCPGCNCTPGQFIAAACDFLMDNDGAQADDPGYFE